MDDPWVTSCLTRKTYPRNSQARRLGQNVAVNGTSPQPTSQSLRAALRPPRILQRVAGHQDPAVTARYLHPDVQAMLEAGTAFSASWSVAVRSGRRWVLSTVARMSVEYASD